MTATRKHCRKAEDIAAKATEAQARVTAGGVLYLAFELGWNEWKLAFSTGPAASVRLRTIRGRNVQALMQEIAKAKERFGLDEQAPVHSCYEAGRDGFWLHRFLQSRGISNQVVDSSSIEVKRRGRRRKTDRLDVGKLLSMLIRWQQGERDVWNIVQVPSVADEDRRQLHRDLLELKGERTLHVNRVKGLLAGQGLKAPPLNDEFPEALGQLRTWDDQAVPSELQQRLGREYERWRLVDRQIKDLEGERARRIRGSDDGSHESSANKAATDKALTQVRQLIRLRGIGANSAWLYVMEFFSWRNIANRKQLAALAGLAPTPYQSGDSDREQGISKAGNRRLRTMAVEIAWCWLQFQPGSALSQWYEQRFAKGSSRQRRIGIVAVARKLLVALWRFLETGEMPSGAEIVPWKPGLRTVSEETTAGNSTAWPD